MYKTQCWSKQEHERFLTGLKEHKSDNKNIAKVVGTRTQKQVESYLLHLRKKKKVHVGSLDTELSELLNVEWVHWSDEEL